MPRIEPRAAGYEVRTRSNVLWAPIHFAVYFDVLGYAITLGISPNETR